MQEELHRDGYSVQVASREPYVLSLLDDVISGKLKPSHTYLDNTKTFIARVDMDDKSIIVKIPRARNNRLWERFLTLFRPSESFRHHRSISLLRSLGFDGPEPILAAEKRRSGFVTDSFLIYGFVEGAIGTAADAPSILKTLTSLHQLGYLRNDPSAKNFLINEGRVSMIDFKLSRPVVFKKLRMQMEVANFVRYIALPPEVAVQLLEDGRLFHVAYRLAVARAFLKRTRRRLVKAIAFRGRG